MNIRAELERIWRERPCRHPIKQMGWGIIADPAGGYYKDPELLPVYAFPCRQNKSSLELTRNHNARIRKWIQSLYEKESHAVAIDSRHWRS